MVDQDYQYGLAINNYNAHQILVQSRIQYFVIFLHREHCTSVNNNK